jgi:hypothetical protein
VKRTRAPSGQRASAENEGAVASTAGPPTRHRPDSRRRAPSSPTPPAAQLHIDYPMLFQVENRRDKRSTHCGVLEFVADEGMMYMPYWVRGCLLGAWVPAGCWAVCLGSVA